MPLRKAVLAAAFLAVPDAALAAGLDGRALGLAWALPFAGILLSIALFPLFAPHAWEHHQGKIAAFWAALVLVPMAAFVGPATALSALAHTALLEYLPFILLLLALFTVAGGIVVRGNIHGAPVANTVLLAIGMALASVIGTTGASMVMIRPVLRANDDRRHNAHVVIFFIFLVSNIGGALTPARRSAPLSRLPARRELFLDDDASFRRDAVRRRHRSVRVLPPRPRDLPQGGPRPARSDAGRCRESRRRHQLRADRRSSSRRC